jgi:outer membrane receptor protein involved in Fe transport
MSPTLWMHRVGRVTAAASFLAAAAGSAPAQQGASASRDTTRKDAAAVRLAPITVTATRTETSVFDVPAPVSVLDRSAIRERVPNSVSDLFRGLPGLDVTGVGTNQVRPVIRGERGQRVLLLEDGLRLNNSRRQSDFGEIPGLVDVSGVDRVEIVRGPASVLYGSDAIGGVVNIITQRPEVEGLHGSAGYRYSTHDGQQNVHGAVTGRFGDVSFMGRGAFRHTTPYDAPAGSFGDITLTSDTRVNDTGLKNYTGEAYLGYRLGRGQDLYVRYERYAADSAGFGYVDPAAYAPDQPAIKIRYPYQRFDRVTAGYTGTALGLPVADRVEATGYWQGNRRRLTLDIQIPFDTASGMTVDQRNFTDIATVGARLELQKLAGSRVALTYGADFFRDASQNSDTNLTSMYGFGPPMTDSATVPLVPNASFTSLGIFGQSEFRLARRASLIVGVRYQDVGTGTRTTPGVTDPPVHANDRTVVGAVNGIVGLTDRVSLVGSFGRAFRSPNLIERFFNGPTPEGFGYQIPNPDLKAETSLSGDLGVRYRDRAVSVEGFVFQNQIYSGIRIQAVPDSQIGGLPVYQDVNVERLRARGIELNGDVRLPAGVAVGGSFTHLDTKNVTQDQNNPVGDGFSSQIVGFLRYDDPSGRFFGEYRVRHDFVRKDSELPAGNPVGAVLPAFTTMSVRAGAVVLRRGALAHRLSVGVTNLTDALYAEFANVSFFRPEPKRSLVVTYDVTF